MVKLTEHIFSHLISGGYETMVFMSGFLLIILGIVMKFFPPRKINNYYGFRSDLAKSSQKAWDLAQQHSRKMNISYGFKMIAVGAITGYLLILKKAVYIVIGIELFILMPIFTFARNGETEKYLRKKLDIRNR